MKQSDWQKFVLNGRRPAYEEWCDYVIKSNALRDIISELRDRRPKAGRYCGNCAFLRVSLLIEPCESCDIITHDNWRLREI